MDLNLFTGMKLNTIEATNTRLMGVVGLVAYWQDQLGNRLVQIFHLDYELYGIDGYHHLYNPTDETLQNHILSVTGGLGGRFVKLSKPEYVHLVLTAYNKHPESIEEHVDFEVFQEYFSAFRDELTEAEVKQLLYKLTPELGQDTELLNYLLMRIVGCDVEAIRHLMTDQLLIENTTFFEQPYTLIKNTNFLLRDEQERTTYRTESVVDYEERYRIVVFEVQIDKSQKRVCAIEKLEELTISSIEASFNLNRPEYIIVTQLKDAFFERKFVQDNPEMMRQSYYQGQLFIEFNAHNDHVKENPYLLNGDIYAMYFFTRNRQLLIASFSEDNLKSIDAVLREKHAYEESLHFVCEIKTDDPVIFDFINSHYENLFDFLAQ